MKNQITIILFKVWPSYRFSKAKSYNFHFHKNDVTWPLNANGLLRSLQVCEHYFRKGFAFKWLVVILFKYTVTFPSSSSQDILLWDCISFGSRCRSCTSAVWLELSSEWASSLIACCLVPVVDCMTLCVTRKSTVVT